MPLLNNHHAKAPATTSIDHHPPPLAHSYSQPPMSSTPPSKLQAYPLYDRTSRSSFSSRSSLNRTTSLPPTTAASSSSASLLPPHLQSSSSLHYNNHSGHHHHHHHHHRQQQQQQQSSLPPSSSSKHSYSFSKPGSASFVPVPASTSASALDHPASAYSFSSSTRASSRKRESSYFPSHHNNHNHHHNGMPTDYDPTIYMENKNPNGLYDEEEEYDRIMQYNVSNHHNSSNNNNNNKFYSSSKSFSRSASPAPYGHGNYHQHHQHRQYSHYSQEEKIPQDDQLASSKRSASIPIPSPNDNSFGKSANGTSDRMMDLIDDDPFDDNPADLETQNRGRSKAPRKVSISRR